MSETSDPAAVVDRSADVATAARGAGVVAAGSLFSSVIRLVVSVLLARQLGADDYGAYILAVTVAYAVSGIVSLGLHLATERQTAVYLRRGDLGLARGSLRTAVAVSAVAAAVGGVAMLVFSDPLARNLFESPPLGDLFVVSAMAIPVLVLTSLFSGAVRGTKRMDLATIADDVIQPTGRGLLLAVVAIAGLSAYRAGVVFVVSCGLALAFLVAMTQRRLRLWGPGPRPTHEHRELALQAFPFWLTGILRVLRTRLQPLLLGIFGTTAGVGVFSVVTSANAVGRLANSSIGTALRPLLAELHDDGDAETLRRIYLMTTRWTLAVNLPVFVVMVLVPESLLAIFGPQFDTGVTPLVIVATAEVVNAATGMCGPIISMSSFHKVKIVNSSAWMVVSIAANVALIPVWGLIGAAVAVVVSTTAVNAIRVWQLWRLMRVLPWDHRIWKVVVAAVATFTAGRLALVALPAVLSIPELVVFSLAVAAFFVAVVVVLGIEAEDRQVADELFAPAVRRCRSAVHRVRRVVRS